MSTFAMHVAKTGLNSQQIKMQVIANNLAGSRLTALILNRFFIKSCVGLATILQKIPALPQACQLVLVLAF